MKPRCLRTWSAPLFLLLSVLVVTTPVLATHSLNTTHDAHTTTILPSHTTNTTTLANLAFSITPTPISNSVSGSTTSSSPATTSAPTQLPEHPREKWHVTTFYTCATILGQEHCGTHEPVLPGGTQIMVHDSTGDGGRLEVRIVVMVLVAGAVVAIAWGL